MKNSLKLPLILSCFVILVASGKAQISYNFEGTTSDLFTYEAVGIGQLTDSTTRNTYYANGTAGGSDIGLLKLNTARPLNIDWTVTLSILIPINLSGVSSLGNNEGFAAGLTAAKTGASDGSDLNLEIEVDNEDGMGTNDRQIFSEYSDENNNGTLNNAFTTLTTVTLKLVYDYTSGAGTGMLSAWGDSTQIGPSFDLLNGTTGWDANAGSDTASIYLYMSSQNIDLFNSGQPTFTSFTATAVPEPATTAALMGLFVLGAVIARRRIKQ